MVFDGQMLHTRDIGFRVLVTPVPLALCMCTHSAATSDPVPLCDLSSEYRVAVVVTTVIVSSLYKVVVWEVAFNFCADRATHAVAKR